VSKYRERSAVQQDPSGVHDQYVISIRIVIVGVITWCYHTNSTRRLQTVGFHLNMILIALAVIVQNMPDFQVPFVAITNFFISFITS
jgi:hypothetical protein